jgi:hypothetical protein
MGGFILAERCTSMYINGVELERILCNQGIACTTTMANGYPDIVFFLAQSPWGIYNYLRSCTLHYCLLALVVTKLPCQSHATPLVFTVA